MKSYLWLLTGLLGTGSGAHAATDLVIDNGGVDGDAVVEIPGLGTRVGPTSTVTGTLILNLVAVQVIETILARGGIPDVFVSSNAGGEGHNEQLIQSMRRFNRHL